MFRSRAILDVEPKFLIWVAKYGGDARRYTRLWHRCQHLKLICKLSEQINIVIGHSSRSCGSFRASESCLGVNMEPTAPIVSWTTCCAIEAFPASVDNSAYDGESRTTKKAVTPRTAVTRPSMANILAYTKAATPESKSRALLRLAISLTATQSQCRQHRCFTNAQQYASDKQMYCDFLLRDFRQELWT